MPRTCGDDPRIVEDFQAGKINAPYLRGGSCSSWDMSIPGRESLICVGLVL